MKKQLKNKQNNRNFFTNIHSKADALMKKDFNLVKNAKFYMIAPIVILLVGIIVFACLGFNLGLDFTGGTILKVRFGSNITNEQYTTYKSDIDNILAINGINKYTLQREGKGADVAVSIKFQDVKGKNASQMEELTVTVKTQLTQKLNPDNNLINFKVEDSQRIGASASKDLLINAILAVSLATLGMLIYIAFRFEFASGIAAIVALFHDVIIMCACVAMFRIEIGSSFIAALITIIGYSINNTIVIFDRVRENLRKEQNKNKTNAQIIDISVKDTLLRTINTSITTVFAVFLLAVIGVQSIRDFIIPILIGLLAGTYSSIFISGPIWSLIYDRKKDRKLQKKLLQKENNDNDEKIEKTDKDKIVV